MAKAKARHTTERDINATVRGKLALELRTAGLTLDEIARRCDYANRSGAFHAIRRELDRIPVEDAEQLRKIEHLRIEQLYALVFPLVAGGVTLSEEDDDDDDDEPKKKNKVNLFAVDRLIMLMERHAKLMNLDVRPDDQETQQDYEKKIVLVPASMGGANG